LGRIFGGARLGALLIAAALMFQPSAVNAQVTTYSATTHSDVTVLPLADYAIPIPNLTILSGYDFTSRTPQDFIPFAQNLGFNVQVVGDLTGSSWSISVYTPGNAKPVMEVDSKAGASTGQPSGTLPLMCAWGPNKTATVDFGEDGTPSALFPPSDCPNAIFVQVSSQPGSLNSPPFAAFGNNPVLQNTQDAVNYLNSQLSSIPGAPQLLFAPPTSPNCAKITIVPAATSAFPLDTVADERNWRFLFGTPLAPNGMIRLTNDGIENPTTYAAGPLLEHELLHALGLGHTGEAMGHPARSSSTDIMSLTAESSDGTRVFRPLTADEKQALTEIYGSNPIKLSASQRQKFCKVIDPNATSGGGGAPPPPAPGSCSLSCQFPQVVEPNSCSCVCVLTASSCFPASVDAQNCQCYSVKTRICVNACPQGSFADPTANCQCTPEIGPQGGGDGCDPSKQVGDGDGNGIQCQ
jgi:hypothetical protein